MAYNNNKTQDGKRRRRRCKKWADWFLFWISVFNVLPLIQMHYQLLQYTHWNGESGKKYWHRNAIDMAMAMKMKITLLVERKMLMDFEQIKSTDAIASQTSQQMMIHVCVRNTKNRQVGIFHFFWSCLLHLNEQWEYNISIIHIKFMSTAKCI